MKLFFFIVVLLFPGNLLAQQSPKMGPEQAQKLVQKLHRELQTPTQKNGLGIPRQREERPPPTIMTIFRDRIRRDPKDKKTIDRLVKKVDQIKTEKGDFETRVKSAENRVKWLEAHTEPGNPNDPRALLPPELPWHKPLGYFAFLLNGLYAIIIMRYALKYYLEKLFKEQIERRFSMPLGYSMFVSTIGATVMPGLIGIRHSHFTLLTEASMVVTLGAVVWPCVMVRVGESFKKRRNERASSRREIRAKMRVEIQKEFGRIGTNLFVWFIFGLIAYGEWQRAPFAVFGLIMEMTLRLPQVIHESKMEEASRLITGRNESVVEAEADDSVAE